MQEVFYVEEVEQARALLTPLRIELMKLLAEPRTCPELADHPHYATNVDGIGEGDNLAADYAATPDALARDAARRLDHFRTAVDRIGARADVRAALAARTDDDYFEAGAWTVVRLLDRASDAAALAAEATSAARRAALASLATYYAGYVPRDLRAALAAA